MADRGVHPVDGQASPVLHDFPEPIGKLFGGLAGHPTGNDIAGVVHDHFGPLFPIVPY